MYYLVNMFEYRSMTTAAELANEVKRFLNQLFIVRDKVLKYCKSVNTEIPRS